MADDSRNSLPANGMVIDVLDVSKPGSKVKVTVYKLSRKVAKQMQIKGTLPAFSALDRALRLKSNLKPKL